MSTFVFYFLLIIILITWAVVIKQWRTLILALVTTILTSLLMSYLENERTEEEALPETLVRKLRDGMNSLKKWFETGESFSLVPDRTIATDGVAEYIPPKVLAWSEHEPQDAPARTLYPGWAPGGPSRDEFSVFDSSEALNQFIDGGEIPSTSRRYGCSAINDFGITADGKIAYKNMKTAEHAKTAATGAARLTSKQFEKFYLTELDEAENRDWWGNKAIETDYTPY